MAADDSKPDDSKPDDSKPDDSGSDQPADAAAKPEPPAAPIVDSTVDSTVGSLLPPVTIPEPDTGYTPAGVPTLEGVREKIETRYGTALGAAELAEDTAAGRSVTERYEARQKAAADKLDEIRASMGTQPKNQHKTD